MHRLAEGVSTRATGRQRAGRRADLTTLAVWRFDTPDAASRAATALQPAGLPAYDAALAAWEPGQRRPHIHGLPAAYPGALDPGFWGLLFGLIFFVPLLGAAVGTTTGALAGALADVGIDDHFMNSVRDQVSPGTSALFVLGSDATVAAVHDALDAGPGAAPITAQLAAEQAAALREVFGN